MTLSGHSLPLSACDSDKLRAALAYWDRVRGPKAMPSRAEILPEEMLAFLPQAIMIRVSHDPFDLHWSIFGGNHAEGAGRDYTGRPVREIQPPSLADLAWAQYSEAVAAREPLAHCMEVHGQGGLAARCVRVSLPLSNDGTTVDRLLAVSETPRAFWDAVKRIPLAAAS